MTFKKFWQFIANYLWGAPFLIIIVYLANTDYQNNFRLNWSAFNLFIGFSYLVCYPIFMLRHPKSRRWFRMESYSTKAIRRNLTDNENPEGQYHAATNPIGNRYNLDFANYRRDDLLNLAVELIISGGLILLSIPLLIIDLGFAGYRKRYPKHH